MQISGCECEGADCGRVTPTEAECREAHRGCARLCGGFTVFLCQADEFCDFGYLSRCGGDSSEGVCMPRPTDCAAPGGGSPVCGCDGNAYPDPCAAHLAGASVTEDRWCEPVSGGYRSARAIRSCLALDVAQWSFSLTRRPTSCDGGDASEEIRVAIWGVMPRTGAWLTPDDDPLVEGREGSVVVCEGGPYDCVEAAGAVLFHRFEENVGASLDYDFHTPDGRRFAESDVVIDDGWCLDPLTCR